MVSKKIISFLTIILILVLSACSSEKTPEDPYLSFTIKLSERSYYQQDEIPILFVVANISDEEVIINNTKFFLTPFMLPIDDVSTITVHIISDSGQEYMGSIIDRIIKRDPDTPDDFHILKPGETLEKSYLLNKIYSPNIWSKGKYSIYATYENSVDPGDGRLAWKGSVTSNKVSITIK